MVHYEIEQGKINIYTDLSIEDGADPRDLAKDYSEINSIIEKLFPDIKVVMLPSD